jgi:predicted nucleotidyltransferase
MTFVPVFPTILHKGIAEIVRDYFLRMSSVDTVLIVNSCARGQAVPESDLDFAILVKPETSKNEKIKIESLWQSYMESEATILHYRRTSPFAHLHLDVIDGNYIPGNLGIGEPIDYFEVEIGNQICYSAPMNNAGQFFNELQSKWLPYYDELLRLERLQMVKIAFYYDLDHAAAYAKRQLYFQAFDILYRAFQKYLQALFIANKVYPIAYNKWIKEQVVKWLNAPDLYPRLSPNISMSNIENNEIFERIDMLRDLANNSPNF